MTIGQLFNGQSRTMGAAAGILFLSSLGSGILGFVRNGLLSWRFGASEATDIYFAAFRIPDLLYGVLIMGGVSAIFLPLFAEHMEQSPKEAWKFANNLLNTTVLFLALFALFIGLFAHQLIALVAPGFSPTQLETTANLTRLMLLSPLLFGISAVFSGVLHYFQRFFAYALAPLLYNMGIIFGILFLAPIWNVWGVAFGVVIGALLHILIQAPAVFKTGFFWLPISDVKDPSLQKATVLAFPRMIAVGGFYINMIVVTALASLISEGSITIFEYANNVQQLPVGLLGVPFALAVFPMMSRIAAQRNMASLREVFWRATSGILFFALPLVVLIFLLRAQIIRLIYGTGIQFGWDETRLTAASLGIFAFGVVSYTLIPLLTRAFFALQDTKTPTGAGIGGIVLNIGAAVFLIHILTFSNPFSELLISLLKLKGIEDVRILALPLAFVISGFFQGSLLLALLIGRIGRIVNKELPSSIGKTLAASAITGLATYGMLQLYGTPFPLETYGRVLTQFLLVSSTGAFAFLASAFLLRSPELTILWRKARSLFLSHRSNITKELFCKRQKQDQPSSH